MNATRRKLFAAVAAALVLLALLLLRPSNRPVAPLGEAPEPGSTVSPSPAEARWRAVAEQVAAGRLPVEALLTAEERRAAPETGAPGLEPVQAPEASATSPLADLPAAETAAIAQRAQLSPALGQLKGMRSQIPAMRGPSSSREVSAAAAVAQFDGTKPREGSAPAARLGSETPRVPAWMPARDSGPAFARQTQAGAAACLAGWTPDGRRCGSSAESLAAGAGAFSPFGGPASGGLAVSALLCAAGALALTGLLGGIAFSRNRNRRGRNAMVAAVRG